MAAISVEVPLAQQLLCDSRAAEQGDAVDLYLDPDKYPGADPNPIRGVILSVECPEADDPVNSVSVITVEIDDEDLPVGLSTLESCDLEKVHCVDCCVRVNERIDELEQAASITLISDGAVPGGPPPSTFDPTLDDDHLVFAWSPSGLGLHFWDPQQAEWRRIPTIVEHNAALGAPDGLNRLVVITGAGTFETIDWYPGDVAYFNDGAGWTKISVAGEYSALGAKLNENNLFTGSNTFQGLAGFSGAVTISTASTVFFNSSLGSIGGSWTDGSSWTKGFGSVTFFDSGSTLDLDAGSTFTVQTDAQLSGDIIHTGTEVGLFGAAPVVQAAHIADPAGGGTIDAEARTAINSILVALENIGITASV